MSPNFMVIGLQIGKLHKREESATPGLTSSEKPNLFRFKEFREICLSHISAEFEYFEKQLMLMESPDHVL